MIRFAAIADMQYADMDEKIGRRYRDSIEKFLICAGEIARSDASFALNLGDALQEDWASALAVDELFRVSAKYGKIRWRHVLGNHDFLVPDKRKPEIYRLLGLKKPGYYDFKLADPDDADNKWRVVVLNGNEISSYASENDAEREAAKQERERRRIALKNNELPHNYNGSLSATQLAWLDERLDETDASGENALVCSHFPLYARSGSLNSKRTRLASLIDLDVYYFNLGVSTWNGKELLDLLDRHKSVRGYLAGHLHEGSYGVRNGVAHITLKGIVETPGNCYAYIDLKRDGIVVDGRFDQPSYKHEFAR